jgi:FtsP/CotA-like multicopper oxidase with cupredoxin domain
MTAVALKSPTLSAILFAALSVLPAAAFAQSPTATGVSAKPDSGNVAGKSFDLKLVDGKLAGGPATVRVQQGDAVQLHWTSNVPMSLHLHGYDLAIPLQPNVPAVTSFAARLPGRFPVSDHGAGAGHERAVLYLEVLP